MLWNRSLSLFSKFGEKYQEKKKKYGVSRKKGFHEIDRLGTREFTSNQHAVIRPCSSVINKFEPPGVADGHDCRTEILLFRKKSFFRRESRHRIVRKLEYTVSRGLSLSLLLSRWYPRPWAGDLIDKRYTV